MALRHALRALGATAHQRPGAPATHLRAARSGIRKPPSVSARWPRSLSGSPALRGVAEDFDAAVKAKCVRLPAGSKIALVYGCCV